MKILIADDDLTSRSILHALLSKWGYDVVGAEDGEEAWTLLQQTQAPQMAVLDWMMPGMDGVKLCRNLRIQERGHPLYIILLTSKGERKHIIEGLEAGADDYIAKPYNNEELRARINVGCRMLELQNKLLEKEKLQGVLEMAGAVCHELNQPLQAVSGWSELLLMDLPEKDPNCTALRNIKASVNRIGELTRKIMMISTYKTMDYLSRSRKIIDINKSAFSQGEKPFSKGA